jgi:hypothetical protein
MDDTVICIGVDVEGRPEHLRATNATRTKENADKTLKGHHRCTKKLVEWWMAEYPTLVHRRESRPNEVLSQV